MKTVWQILILTLALLFCFLPVQSKAQEAGIDSLQQLLKSTNKVERKVDLLNEIAHRYAASDEKNCKHFARMAMELASQTDYKKGIGNSYLIIAYAWEKFDPDSSVFYYNKAIDYFNQINEISLLTQVYNNLGLIFKDKGLYQQALEQYFKALSIVKNEEQKGMIYNNMGIVFRRSGSYDRAIEYFIKSLTIREGLKDLHGLAITNGNLGNLYLNQKQYEKALEYYEKAKSLFTQLNNPLFEAHALQNMGIINTNIKNYKAALQNFDHALDIYHSNGHEIGRANTFINKARIFAETNDFAEALINNLNAIELLIKYNLKEYLTSAYIEAGKAYLQLGKDKDAYNFFNVGLQVSKEIGNKQKEADGYEGLYKYHEEQKNYAQALNYYKLYTQLKDSLFNEDVSKRMSAILSNAEIEKREIEKDLLQDRIRRKELENKGLVGGAIFLSLFAIYFFNTTQQKKKTNKLLSAQNDEINQKQQQIISINESLQKSQDQLYKLNDELQKLNEGLEITVTERTHELQKSHEELDTFLYQSSHALRRPIVNIMGLVQIARIEPEFATVPNIYDRIEDTAARMDLMLKKLVMVSEINLTYQNYEMIDFEELISETISSLGPELLLKKIEIRKNVQVKGLFKSDKRLVSIILLNLMENAINFYDDCDGRKAFIEVSINENCEFLDLEFRDNGIGIPNDLMNQVFDMFYIATTRSKGYGLGLYIVKKAVEKLKGKISIFSKENKFTCITISIPRSS